MTNKNSIKEESMASAVISQNVAVATNSNSKMMVVPIEMLAVPLSHPRRTAGDMESLKESIKVNGLLEHLIVCKSEDGKNFLIIDGLRRLTVIVELQWKYVPCVVLESMPSQRYEKERRPVAVAQ